METYDHACWPILDPAAAVQLTTGHLAEQNSAEALPERFGDGRAPAFCPGQIEAAGGRGGPAQTDLAAFLRQGTEFHRVGGQFVEGQ